MKTEIWRDIPGYEGLYRASNLGNIMSLARTDARGWKRKEKRLKSRITKCGYRQINLRDGESREKSFLVHRLIALAFLGLPDEIKKTDVHHIDENRCNNNLDNLEWCTRSYNVTYGNCQKKRIKSRRKKGALECAQNF